MPATTPMPAPNTPSIATSTITMLNSRRARRAQDAQNRHVAAVFDHVVLDERAHQQPHDAQRHQAIDIDERLLHGELLLAVVERLDFAEIIGVIVAQRRLHFFRHLARLKDSHLRIGRGIDRRIPLDEQLLRAARQSQPLLHKTQVGDHSVLCALRKQPLLGHKANDRDDRVRARRAGPDAARRNLRGAAWAAYSTDQTNRLRAGRTIPPCPAESPPAPAQCPVVPEMTFRYPSLSLLRSSARNVTVPRCAPCTMSAIATESAGQVLPR